MLKFAKKGLCVSFAFLTIVSIAGGLSYGLSLNERPEVSYLRSNQAVGPAVLSENTNHSVKSENWNSLYSETPKVVVQKVSAKKASSGSTVATGNYTGFAQIYSLINQYRQANGLSPLSANSLLEKSASMKNQQMVSTGQFAHDISGYPNYAGLIRSVGYSYTTAGENLAEGFSTPSSTFQAWKASPGHNANLLKAGYKDMGVSAVCGVNMPGYPSTCLVTLHFGAR